MSIDRHWVTILFSCRGNIANAIPNDLFCHNKCYWGVDANGFCVGLRHNERSIQGAFVAHANLSAATNRYRSLIPLVNI